MHFPQDGVQVDPVGQRCARQGGVSVIATGPVITRRICPGAASAGHAGREMTWRLIMMQ
jgi:hypothetical protein